MVREFARRGHRVCAATPLERRQKKKTFLKDAGSSQLLCVRTLNNTKVGFLEKGAALLTTPWLLRRGVQKHFPRQRFDLILYSTPPVTISPAIRQLRKKHHAATYCLLKDIWPQTAVDLGAVKAGGLMWKYLRRMERELYDVSDHIGCMSQGNVEYLRRHEGEQTARKAEICPNSMEIKESGGAASRGEMRAKYGIPQDAMLLVYGGSIGLPQGVPFIREILARYKGDARVYFLLIGNGTDYAALKEWLRAQGISNAQLLPYMDVEAYRGVLSAADVGLVFLNAAFTTPNIPSRTLDYLATGLPVLAAIDAATDYGSIIEQGGFGLASVSGDLPALEKNMQTLSQADIRKGMGQKGRAFLEQHWTAAHSCDIILEHVTKEE